MPQELEAIEQERIPDLDSISFEDIANSLEATLRRDRRRSKGGDTTSVTVAVVATAPGVY